MHILWLGLIPSKEKPNNGMKTMKVCLLMLKKSAALITAHTIVAMLLQREQCKRVLISIKDVPLQAKIRNSLLMIPLRLGLRVAN